jgi:hypothetical protein
VANEKNLSKRDTLEFIADALRLFDEVLDGAMPPASEADPEAAEVVSDAKDNWGHTNWYKTLETREFVPFDWSYDADAKKLYIDRGDGIEVVITATIPRPRT